ncbi:hypothetical protein [Archangium violaceum]|uniref:hypothetical protein n=1 Tax=Archangium violaceum TaxID=83451 RepID=UPI001362A528|nr:hypothetical protein [Archangium violaceum]
MMRRSSARNSSASKANRLAVEPAPVLDPPFNPRLALTRLEHVIGLRLAEVARQHQALVGDGEPVQVRERIDARALLELL